MFQGNDPIPCEVLPGHFKVKSVQPGESGPLLEIESKVRINLSKTDEALTTYMLGPEAGMVNHALELTTPSKEDKKPHTVEIKVLRAFERSEYALALDDSGNPVLYVADVKGKAMLKIVGSEVSMELKLIGLVPAASLPAMAVLVGQKPTIVANAPEQLELLDTDDVTPRKRSPERKEDASGEVGEPPPLPPAA